MITAELCRQIYFVIKEIEACDRCLEKIEKEREAHKEWKNQNWTEVDIERVNRGHCFQLHIPTGFGEDNRSWQIDHISGDLAAAVVRAHKKDLEAGLAALNEQVRLSVMEENGVTETA